MKLTLTTIALFFFLLFSRAQEIYKNDKYQFEIEFPDFFEEKEEDRDDMHVISLSATHNKMILLTSIFEYKEKIPQDEYNLKEVESLVLTADAFKSKFKVKKLTKWKVGQFEGYRNPIKGKVKTQKGTKLNYYGCMYVLVIKEGLEFRVTILAQNKKYYLSQIEKDFVASIKLSQ